MGSLGHITVEHSTLENRTAKHRSRILERRT